MNKLILCVAGSLLCLMSVAHADNWPHWRGEAGNGVSSTAKPPTEWSATKNVKWKVAVPGLGSGSPVVWGDQVFVTTAVGTGTGKPLQFKLVCFDRWSPRPEVRRHHDARARDELNSVSL